jgi:adenylate cyclase
MNEIERKFLVYGDAWRALVNGTGRPLCQAYLSTDPDRVVRIRIDGERAFLTIKGRNEGITRPEYEYSIPKADARELLALACTVPVEKIRHHIASADGLWEIDEFLGANAGLVVAEIELNDAAQCPTPPFPVLREVSDETRYYNSNLALRPYSLWSDAERFAAER